MKKNMLTAIFLLLSFYLFAENRFALLIANGQYKSFSSLAGPTIEAKSLALTLKKLGFEVRLLENATREQMLEDLDNIRSRINGKGGIAFFHYGGHGVQAQGRNYLIPVDADIPDEKKLSTRAVDMDEVMSSLDSCGSDTNIVILDACRNNPLPAGAGRSASRGLSVIGAKPKNSIIVYSAEAGTIAQDGLFTPTLTSLITQQGKSFNQILMQLRKEVSQKSNGSQIPGEYNQLFDDIYLNGLNTTTNDNDIPSGLASADLPRDSTNNNQLKSGSHNKIIFSTNFADNNSFKLLLNSGQKMDPKKDYAVVYGTTPIGGGALIGLPFPLELGTRIIIEFEDLEKYEFGFSLGERMEKQIYSNSYGIFQMNGNLQASEYPWKFENNKWNANGKPLLLTKAEFRYEPDNRYKIIMEIGKDGSSFIEIQNKENKSVRIESPFKFRNIPFDLHIRSNGGSAKYYSMIVEEL